MNLDDLRSAQSKERQKDSLQSLRPSFYREVGEYIATLKAERDRAAEAASDPFSSPEVGQLTDEIETAKDVAEAIYERRMGKLVKQASLAAAGMPANDEGLTEEEAELFSDLVDRIRENKGRVLDVLEWSQDAADAQTEDTDSDVGDLEPETGSANPDPTESVESADSGVSVADAIGGDIGEPEQTDPDALIEELAGEGDVEVDSEPEGESRVDEGSVTTDDTDGEPVTTDDPDEEGPVTADDPTEARIERTTVRITRDVGSILGIDDREYTLANDDVVTLPESNATPLIERDAAEPIE